MLQHRVGGGAGVGAERGLTMMVLTVLHMDGGKMEESEFLRWGKESVGGGSGERHFVTRGSGMWGGA